MNSGCFKLHSSYSISFNLSNVCDPKGLSLCLGKQKRNHCLAFTSPIKVKRAIRKFHVAVVQGRQRNSHLKKVWGTYKVAVQPIYSSNTFALCSSCCRRRRRRRLISLYLRKTCCLSFCAISLLSGCDNTQSISLSNWTVMARLCKALYGIR